MTSFIDYPIIVEYLAMSGYFLGVIIVSITAWMKAVRSVVRVPKGRVQDSFKVEQFFLPLK